MKKKIINHISLITVCLILVLTFININILNRSNYYLGKNNHYSRESLELSDYSSFFEGNGENINTSLHQSYLNNSFNAVLNTSDSNNNKFTVPCPTDTMFNSSYVNMTVDNIYAPNKKLIIETTSILTEWIYDNDVAIGFQVKGSSILDNFSICFSETHANNYDALIGFEIFNAQWSNGKIDLGPTLLKSTWIETIHDDVSHVWYNFTNINTFLNVSETYQNYFFLRITQATGPTQAQVEIECNVDGTVDDAIFLKWSGSSWNSRALDPLMTLDLKPYAPNKTLEIEDGHSYWHRIKDGGVPYRSAGSFKVDFKCYLTNISVYLYYDDSANPCDLRVRVLDSVWSGSASMPGTTVIGTLSDIDQMSFTYIDGWLNNFSSLFSPIFLDPEQTDNNTFFIDIRELGNSLGDFYWCAETDTAGEPDDSYAYVVDGGWQEIKNGPFDTVDLSLSVSLSPFSNIPNPQDIGMQINGINVSDSGIRGLGYWVPSLELGNDTGYLNFNVKANWWDVTCYITKVQINYTKTDLKANSLYKVSGSEQDVLWNVSRFSGLNFFDSRLSDYRINFTIPSNWDNVNVFKGGTNKTEDISISSSKNGYVIVKVSNAGNGTYWHLTATSVNMIELIEMYADSTITNVVNYADLVHFNATFKEELAENNGIINLMIYNPAMINNKLNFSSSNSTFNSGSEFYLGKWDLSDTVVEYGEFRVQVFWNNDTAAGFIEKILTVMGQTDLTLVAPDQGTTYYSNHSFNIVIYYKDSNQLKAIDGATIQYNIDGQGSKSTNANNGTIGYYVIPVNCSIFTTNGTKTVEITTSKNYYESQTLNYNFNVIIVEEKGKQAGEFPLAIIIIAITSIVGGIGVAAATLLILRKKKRLTINE